MSASAGLDLVDESLIPTLTRDNCSHYSSKDIDFPIANNSSSDTVQFIRCVDKLSSSLPSQLTLTDDIIHTSFGFHHIYTIKSHLSNLYQDTIVLDSTPADAVLDAGDLGTIRKAP